MDVELAHHTGAVGVDGFGADGEAGGDFLGAVAFDEHGEDLVLAGGEGFEGVFVVLAIAMGGEDFIDLDGGGEVDAAGGDLLQGVHEVAGGSAFEQDAMSATAKGLDDRFAITATGHEDHAGDDLEFPGLAEEFQGMELGEVEFEEGDIGEFLENEAEGGGAIGTLVHYLDIGVSFAKSDECFAHQLLWFGDEDADWFSIYHDPTRGSRGWEGKFSRKAADGLGFVIMHFENRIELGDLEQVLDPFGEAEEFELAVLASHGGIAIDEFADAGAIDVADFAEIEKEFFVTGGDEVADGIAEKRRAFPKGDAANGIDYSNVTDLAGCETSTHLVDSPW